MRVLAAILLCLSMVAVLWRPHTRGAAVWLSCALLLLCFLLATACSPGERIESFYASQCTQRDTEEWRTRTERGACIARTPDHFVNGHTYGGSCIAWSQHTVHERRQSVACTKERWVSQ